MLDLLTVGPTSTANPPAAAAAVDRRDRQTDGQTHHRFTTLTAYTMQAM